MHLALIGTARRVIVVSVLVILASCAVVTAETHPLLDLIVERVDESNITANLAIGQRLVLLFAPRPITAYRWIYEQEEGRGTIAQEQQRYEPISDPMPGKSVRLRFSFKAIELGCEVLAFKLIAGGNSANVSTIDHFKLRVCVTP